MAPEFDFYGAPGYHVKWIRNALLHLSVPRIRVAAVVVEALPARGVHQAVLRIRVNLIFFITLYLLNIFDLVIIYFYIKRLTQIETSIIVFNAVY